MQQPIALKIADDVSIDAYAIELDPFAAQSLGLFGKGTGPTILIAREAVNVPKTSAIVIDGTDITAVYDGEFANTVLVVLAHATTTEAGTVDEVRQDGGDARFLAETEREAPHLATLANQILSEIRSRGVAGQLSRRSGGRWVNDPINSFTLKVQPRVKNIQFTLYGNPWTFEDREFLKRDQNSYSRGWVKDPSDVCRFADLVAQSHARKS